MTNFEIYALILSVIVFVLLTALGTTCVAYIFKMQARIIKGGLEDAKILEEYEKNKNKKKNTMGKVLNCALNIIFLSFFIFVFSGSIYINCTQNTYFENVPTYRVVKTSSMSKKNQKNQYLFDNNLNNQIQAFDLILTYKVPNEEDLKLYDVVVYETDEMLIVHRIVGIEEPNEKHPNERWFLLQGDAIDSADRFPVTYEQIQGIYKSEKVPFIGSFVLFMQSPAGWLCILLISSAIIITPIVDKKMAKVKQARILLILPNETPKKPEVQTTTEEIGEIKPNTTDYLNSAIVVSEVIKKANSIFDNFSSSRDNRTFIEKLDNSSTEVKGRYQTITEVISKIVDARLIEGKKYHTYKSGNLPIAKFAMRGKTLNAYLGLNPAEYQNTKYIFTDVSGVKAYQNYPMRVKITSSRQAKWASELIEELCVKSGIALLEKPCEIVEKTAETNKKWFDGLGKKSLTFNQKFKIAKPEVKERFYKIEQALLSHEKVRVIESKKSRTYKLGSMPIAKLQIKGKTLNAYLGLNPAEYQNTKYIFTDASSVKAYQNYPMRVRITSNRQAKWAIELIISTITKVKL